VFHVDNAHCSVLHSFTPGGRAVTAGYT